MRFSNRLPAFVALSLMTAALSIRVGAQSRAKTPVEVHEAIKAGVAKANAVDKTLWLDFGASWCSWCKRMDAAMDSPELSRIFSDQFVVVKVTAEEHDDKKATENPGATDMMQKEGGDGLPFYIFYDKAGTRLADSMVMPKHENIGYPGTDEEIKAFGELLQKVAPRITSPDRTKILNYLKAHAPKERS